MKRKEKVGAELFLLLGLLIVLLLASSSAVYSRTRMKKYFFSRQFESEDLNAVAVGSTKRMEIQSDEAYSGIPPKDGGFMSSKRLTPTDLVILMMDAPPIYQSVQRKQPQFASLE
ncbi:hypothetical protein O6H91_Y029500 [Diphasiastrum complanatum]|nr:hypothetical protein O6H91_Y029500 [Diphasiastrum complanatum]